MTPDPEELAIDLLAALNGHSLADSLVALSWATSVVLGGMDPDLRLDAARGWYLGLVHNVWVSIHADERAGHA